MVRPVKRLSAFVAAAATAVTGLLSVAAPASAHSPSRSPSTGAAPSAAPSAASGARGIGIRLADASVARRDDPRALAYVDDFVKPGTTFTRHVQVYDFTPDPVHLLMYGAPASIVGESFTMAARGAHSELTDWMTVTPSTVDLQPGRSTTVVVTFRVPEQASRGERYGAVVAELPATKPKPGRVSVATRVGVRVYLSVGPGGEPASDFTISTLTAKRLADGTPVVTAAVTNTGGRALDLGGTLTLTDGPGGLRAGPYKVTNIPTLAIGRRGTVDIPLDKQTPNGPWLATLRLRSGYVSHAVKGRIVFPSTPGASSTPVKAVPITKNRHVLVPLAIGLILAIVLGLLLFLLWKRRRRKDDEEQDAGADDSGPDLPGQRRSAEDVVRRS
jgi:hypothetical protein